MKKEKLPLKTVITNGIVCGFFYAIIVAIKDIYDGEPLSVIKYVLHFFAFGVFMTAAFRYKYTKD
nr:hypothetical protein [uncultured Psychroserpens sp.]